MALPPLSEDTNRPPGSGWIKTRIVSALRLILALILAFFITQIKLDFFESFLYDMRVRLRPAPPVSGQVSLVMIDENTVQFLKKEPQAKDIRDLIQKLNALHPKAIVFDLDLKDLQGSFEDKKAMAEASMANPEVYFMTDELGVPGQEIRSTYPKPLDSIQVFPGLKSADISNFAKDGVSRRMMIAYQGREMLHLHLAREIHPEFQDKYKIRGLFQFLDSDQMYINFRPEGSYPRLNFIDVVQGRALSDLITDKIIFVGQDLKTSKLVQIGNERMERDYVRTPYSRDVLAMTSAELHANMMDTLIENNAPIRENFGVDFFFVAIISLITVYVVFSLRPLVGLFILGSSFAGFGLVAYFAFWPFGIWISMAHPWLSIFLCYYFFIPYRLIIENRRSWEIYQKHRLLKQVEELKTNFISMMSHDLKTPIARILGMTDVILQDSISLSSHQREAVDTIRQSGDDLLKFINSILSYGRIESQSVQLHREARDINELLNEVILKHEFLAKLKKIQIRKEFETLFPISVDTDLIRQVLSNLIENAIKYSPDETKILVSTEEKNGAVVIQVADQGPGISAEDLPHIFMKFYRSQHAKSSAIKGSGLGLHLAKYFVELHHGKIFVESTYGQGTTFTVELPLG
jgi:signal transduction histidine kinase